MEGVGAMSSQGPSGKRSREPDPIPLEDDAPIPLESEQQTRVSRGETGLSRPGLRRCPRCSNDVSAASPRCGVCGFAFGAKAPGTESKQAGNKPVAPVPALKCPKCGYDASGLSGTRCPECGADVKPSTLRQTTNRKDFAREHRREQYWKPLTMFAVGAAGVALVMALNGEADGIPFYFLLLAANVPIGLAAYFLCCLFWIGFDEPFHVTAVKLLGIYAVVDFVDEVCDLIPIPLLPWIIPIVTYIGLLMSMLDLEQYEAVLIAFVTFFLRTVLVLWLVSMLLQP